MNTTQLDEARVLWLKEKAQYIEYGNELQSELKALFKKNKVPASFSYRPKADDSLLKKMLMKDKPYSEVNDKIGARIIVHFLSDLVRCDNLIKQHFNDRIIKRENKSEESDDNTFGYLSIHYDIINSFTLTPPLVCELQLRTVCQNAWSELSHILSYKPGIKLPKDISREVNALSALMEIADNQFQKILDMINLLPASNPARILKTLEGFFYSNIAAWYDSNMSNYFLSDIGDIYKSEDDIIYCLEEYIELNGAEIASIATQRQDLVFFSQPEIILILERLENNKSALEGYWQNKYPTDQLEAVANAWGVSIY